MPTVFRLCVLILLLAMAGSGFAAVEDDWSVLTEAEIREALGVGDEDAGMGSTRPRDVWLLLAWTAGGVVALVWFAWRTLRRALWFRKRKAPPPPYRRGVWFVLTPLLVLLIVPLPWTLGFLWKEAVIEARTWWYYYAGRPLVLQGIVRHTETREPIPGVWVRYDFGPYNRFSNRPSGCKYDLVLRTNNDGRWRVELPPRAFASMMADHGDTDPQPFLYSPGLYQDYRFVYTEHEIRLIETGHGVHITNRRLRAEKGDAQLWMTPDSSASGRLRSQGVSLYRCRVGRDWIRVAGPRPEMMRAVWNEKRDIVCHGPPEGGAWPADMRLVLPFAGLPMNVQDRYMSLKAQLEGLEPGTFEYDAALCAILTEVEP